MTGKTVEAKVPTTPNAPQEGVLRAVRDHVPAEVLADAAYFLHGTTVGLNALLERRGATVGLILHRRHARRAGDPPRRPGRDV
jgi:N-methylhydantoinase A